MVETPLLFAATSAVILASYALYRRHSAKRQILERKMAEDAMRVKAKQYRQA